MICSCSTFHSTGWSLRDGSEGNLVFKWSWLNSTRQVWGRLLFKWGRLKSTRRVWGKLGVQMRQVEVYKTGLRKTRCSNGAGWSVRDWSKGNSVLEWGRLKCTRWVWGKPRCSNEASWSLWDWSFCLRKTVFKRGRLKSTRWVWALRETRCSIGAGWSLRDGSKGNLFK